MVIPNIEFLYLWIETTRLNPLLTTCGSSLKLLLRGGRVRTPINQGVLRGDHYAHWPHR